MVYSFAWSGVYARIINCFGVNHDTAVAFGVEIVSSSNTQNQDEQQAAELTAFERQASHQLRTEVNAELKRNRTEALSLRPSPLSGMLIPVLVIAIQLFASWRLFA